MLPVLDDSWKSDHYRRLAIAVFWDMKYSSSIIPDTLALELTRVLQYSRREYLDLAWLREIKLIALSVVFKVLKEKNIKVNNPEAIEAFTRYAIASFRPLIAVIYRIEQLPNSDCLTIYLSE